MEHIHEFKVMTTVPMITSTSSSALPITYAFSDYQYVEEVTREKFIAADTSRGKYSDQMVVEVLKAKVAPTVDAPNDTAAFMDWLNTP